MFKGIPRCPIKPNIIITDTAIGKVANKPPTRDLKTKVIIIKIINIEYNRLTNCPFKINLLSTPNKVAAPVSLIGSSS